MEKEKSGMRYKIILDKEELERFIDWLPDLYNGEKYMTILMCRKKYGAKKDCVLARKLSTKEKLYSDIKKLECEEGLYTAYGVPVKNSELALYITVNPRHTRIINESFAHNIIEYLYSNSSSRQSIYSFVMNNIQKFKSRNILINLDFDTNYFFTTLEKIETFINKEAYSIFTTKNGFHCLIDSTKVSKEYIKTYFKNITNIDGCDQKNSDLMPMPGTSQGSYHVGMYSNN